MAGLGVNLLGVAYTIKHAGHAMKAKGGSIIAMSSIAALRHAAYMGIYSVTKVGARRVGARLRLGARPLRHPRQQRAPGLGGDGDRGDARPRRRT